MKVIKILLVALFCANSLPAFSQAQSYQDEPGLPTFAVTVPVENGIINLANGNLHIEIPIATYPQRGSRSMHVRLVYDSRFWLQVTDPVSEIVRWEPNGQSPASPIVTGWNLVTDGEPGFANNNSSSAQCGCLMTDDTGGCIHKIFRTTYRGFFYQEPEGTRHAFNLQLVQNDSGCGLSTPNGSAHATDGSGYRMDVTNYGNMTVFAPDGAQVYPGVQDTDGNYFSLDANRNVIDTLGRTPVILNRTANPMTLDYLCVQICNSAAGDRVRVALPYVDTRAVAFDNTTVPAAFLTSIVLPDGRSYSFTYDPNGMITSIALPTGGVVNYGWSNYLDAQSNLNRWVTSRIADGQTWSFTPHQLPCATQPCSQTVTVTTPVYDDGTVTESDDRVFTFLLDHGSWNTQTQVFRGSAASGHLLATETANFTINFGCGDTTSPQTGTSGGPRAYGSCGLKTGDTVAWTRADGSTVNKKRAFAYDNPVFGTVKTVQEWGYQPNGAFATLPDRQVDNTYITDSAYVAANMATLVKTTAISGPNSAGTQMVQAAQTTNNYDEAAPDPSSITLQHANVSGPRGNVTSISRWLNTSTTPVTTSTSYFDTGMAHVAKDALANPTTFSYDGTGAYVTQVCDALTHCGSQQHDPNTGLVTSATDQNHQTTNFTYDSLLRLTVTDLPDGGQASTVYPTVQNPTTTEHLHKITGTPPEDDSFTYTDGLGRVKSSKHVTGGGSVYVDTVYDPLGHVASMSNPYYTTTDTTYGITQMKYDAVGRTVKTIRQDLSVSTVDYSQGNCVTSTDEAGNQRRGCSDGLGRLTEVDEPGGTDPGSQATASVTVSGAFNTAGVSTGAPHLAAAGSALASLAMSDGSTRTFFLDANQHLCQIYWTSSSGWVTQDLTAATGWTVVASGSAISALVLSDGTIRVAYLSAGQHVNLMTGSGGTWSNEDVTAETGTTNVAGGNAVALTGSAYGYTMHVFYIGTNQHIYHMGLNGTWTNDDLTAATGNTLAATGSSAAAMVMNDGTLHFNYLGTDNHVYHLSCCFPSLSASGWVNQDLSTMAGSALAAPGSSLVVHGVSWGSPFHIYYTSGNQHVYHAYWNSTSGWGSQDLTTMTGSPLTATNSKLTVNVSDADGIIRLHFLGSNQHLYELYCCGPNWGYGDLTAAAGTSVLGASGSALSSHGSVVGSPVSAFFEGSNQHVYRMLWNTGAAAWQIQDPMTGDDNILVDSGTVSLTIPNSPSNFAATACYGTSTNAACAGQPINASPAAIAAALAAALNGTNSPVNATASGSTISMTWRTPAAITATVAPMTSASDYPAQFAGGSFSSTQGSFSGGFPATSQSIRNPLVTFYQYDPLGNLLCVHQKGLDHTTPDKPCGDASVPLAWRERQFTYDSLSQLLQANNPESGRISYSYDAAGNLLQKTSPAPNQTGAATQTISYCYDALHRVTGRADSAQTCSNGRLPDGTAVVSYTYDAGTNNIGHLTRVGDQAGNATYGYDIMGRLATEQRTLPGVPVAVSKTISYDYNFDSSLKALHYPSGAIVTYAPDVAGRALSAVDTGNSLNYVTGASYGPDGALTGFVSGNSSGFAGITNKMIYTPRLQPCRIAAGTGTLPGSCIDQVNANKLDLGYDFHLGNQDNGNVFSILNHKDSTRTQTFTYDALNRLLTAQNSGTDCNPKTLNSQTQTVYWGNSYVYDAWGNLLQKVQGKCTPEGITLIASEKNQLHTGTPGPVTDYGYDAAGNMTSDITDKFTALYDPENRISSVTNTNGTTNYIYDADGNRVNKSNGTLYWYMTPGVVAESDLAGNLKSEYVFFGGKRVARRDFIAPTGVAYYFSDHLKTASVITNAAGTITAESDYYPWGGELRFVNNDSNHYKFTGKERDSESESGLDYFGARYYSNGIGRWISPDPGGPNPNNPQTLNLYRYGLNNPLRYTDPNGFYERDVHFDLTLVLAYAAGYSSDQSQRIARANQGVDDSPVTGPFVSYEARRDFHFTTPARRAELWAFSWNENGLGVYLHAEQDSYSHDGFGPRVGHLSAGHAPDKTYNEPDKADTMANDTYQSLIEAGVNVGTEAGAVPYAQIMPFVQAFNRAKTKKDKDAQLDHLKQFVGKYRKDHEGDKKPPPPPEHPWSCAAEFQSCQ